MYLLSIQRYFLGISCWISARVSPLKDALITSHQKKPQDAALRLLAWADSQHRRLLENSARAFE